MKQNINKILPKRQEPRAILKIADQVANLTKSKIQILVMMEMCILGEPCRSLGRRVMR